MSLIVTNPPVPPSPVGLYDSASIQFLPSGTGAIATTVSEVFQRKKSVFDWLTAAQKADVIARTAAVDVTAACQSAIDWCYDNAYALEWPDGTYWTTKSLLVWGGTDAYTEKGSRFIPGGYTVIRKTTNAGYGGVSAYASDDAIFVFARRDLTAGNSVALKNIHIGQFYLDGDFGSGKVAFGMYNRCSLGASTFDAIVVEAAIGLQSATDMYLCRFSNCTFIVSTKGFSMLMSGTTNVLDNIFVSGATSIGYELRGTNSTGNSLACDSCTGICYSFNSGAWTINGLGSESTSASVVVQTAGPSWVVLNGPFIMPQNNVADKVFNVTGADTLVVNGGRVGSNSSPQALAGQFAAVAASGKLKLNDLAISDTYAVASTGSILRSGARMGAVSVPTATATALYTLGNGEEVGMFYAWLCGGSGNAQFRASSMVGIAGGNSQIDAVVAGNLTLTLAAGVVKVQHAIGTTQTIGWRFDVGGEGTPVSL